MKETIFELEQIARDAWPAGRVDELDGWLLRFHHGVTRRANSVWPNGWVGAVDAAEVEAKIDQVEAFYASLGVPARFQMTPVAVPSDLDQRLAARGYEAAGFSRVQVTNVARALSLCSAPLPDIDYDISSAVELSWFDLQNRGEITAAQRENQKARLGIMQQIEGAIFGQGFVRETAVGQVMGVLNQGWLGVFSLYTDPAWRGKGIGRDLMRCLLAKGGEMGAEQSYLQVLRDNTAALRLYDRLGYEPIYDYHYRSR